MEVASGPLPPAPSIARQIAASDVHPLLPRPVQTTPRRTTNATLNKVAMQHTAYRAASGQTAIGEIASKASRATVLMGLPAHLAVAAHLKSRSVKGHLELPLYFLAGRKRPATKNPSEHVAIGVALGVGWVAR